MEKLFELGNRYAEKSDWKDFALVKFCLCAMGILIGVTIPKKNKRLTQVLAGIVFVTTYVVLMRKVYQIFMEMND